MNHRHVPLQWVSEDRGVWKGRPCTIEYVAEDGMLISYRSPITGRLVFAIVAKDDVEPSSARS